MILAADVGGTNARVALFAPERPRPVASATFRTQDWKAAEDVLLAFLAGHPAAISAACVAIAGSVRAGRSRPINIPWTVDERVLTATLGVPVRLVNDLEANAYGLCVLEPDDLAVVNPGAPERNGNRVVVSAGTGLGEAGLWWDGSRYRAIAGEGGHADFAPRSELEIELYRSLAGRYGHVSYERVCCGSGIVNIYAFLRGRDAGATQPSSTDATTTTPATISAEAAADPSGIAAQALDLFVSIYGARAGSVALSFMATGGVYLGGGIAPRLVERITSGPFMRAFTDKGRFSPFLADVPVYVVRNDMAALLGAAAIAMDGLDTPLSAAA